MGRKCNESDGISGSDNFLIVGILLFGELK